MDIEQKERAINNIIDKVIKMATPTQKYNALLEKVITGERILSELMLKMNKRDAIGLAWEYFYMSPYTWKGNSSKLNITTIPESCKENGKQIVLHYTHAANNPYNPIKGELYCKSTDKDEFGNEVGEQPIFYYGRFEIDKNNFELSFERLKEGFIEFEPKNDASYEQTYNENNVSHHNTKNLFYI